MVLSEPKFQVLHGILHDVFSKEELIRTQVLSEYSISFANC